MPRAEERTSLRSGTKAERFQRGVISLALIALVLLQSVGAVAWGNEGHTAINRVAAQKIPATMPRFLRRAVVEIAYFGPEPDRWRSPSEFALKNSQEPDHFIDLERVSWLDPLPPGRYEFYRKLTKSAPRPRTILTTTFPSMSVCSPISRWKCMAA